jgi:NAD(P)-dependent dehydrogenase (short-subunit alcohol dehydrogenase family)
VATDAPSEHARSLAGKTALVTGASRGIGAAISRSLADAGARIVLVGRTRSTLEELAAELPHDPVVIVADASTADAATTIMEQAQHAAGAVSVLVNNAGGGGAGLAHTLKVDDADSAWALNLRTPLLLAGLAAAGMAEHGGGSIVNITSGVSQQGMAGVSLYSALKSGLESATRSLAAEWGPAGVRVNVVSPGVTRTELGSWVAGNEAVTKKYLEKVPLGRIGEPADIAAAVLFLSSPASTYVTGQVLAVDGGWVTTAPSPLAA